MTPDWLQRLVVQAPQRLLDEVARHRIAVELGLANGQVVKGVVARVEGGIALVHTGGHGVAYVKVDQIVVATLPDASALVHEPLLQADAPTPSRLELHRRVAGLMPPIALAPDLDDAGRRAVGALLPLLTAALSAIARDAMGQGALAQIDGVELSAASTGHVARDGKRLSVRAPILAAEAYTEASLRGALERVL